MIPIRRYPILGALLAQLIAAVGTVISIIVLGRWVGPAVLFWVALVLQGVLAAGVTLRLALPVWWAWIGLFFPLALGLPLASANLPAWPFGLAFLLLYLFFSNTARERVPLYLTNRITTEALISLMKTRNALSFVDLGSGLGGVVRAIHGDGRSARGVETAPMSWLVSALLSRLTGRGSIVRHDIWSTDISGDDVVYAFLSPEPMPALYEKAVGEMKPGSLLVSNSFAVPGIDPDEIWELSDRRKTRLFLYGMKGAGAAAVTPPPSPRG